MNLLAYQAYRNQSVTTASPAELTLMLYEGCLKFIKLSQAAIIQQNFEKKNTHLLKAEKIIEELMVTLDPQIEIAHTLQPMYDYIYRRLIEANVGNDIEILSEVHGYVAQFRDIWKEAMISDRKQRHRGGTEA